MKIKERINIYVCQYGCHNITVDVDKGVTPFMIECEFRGRKDRPANPLLMRKGKCIGTATSCMYPKEKDDSTPYPIPTHEWYRPSLSEYSKLSDAEKTHVKNGGLMLRERTYARALVHGEDDWTWDDVKIPDYDQAIKEVESATAKAIKGLTNENN